MLASYLFELGWLIILESARRVRRRWHKSIFFRWRYSGHAPGFQVYAPQSLRPTYPAIATDIYTGRYNFCGVEIVTGGDSPFSAETSSKQWLTELHGFEWLNHLVAANTHLSRVQAVSLINDWIETSDGSLSSLPWQSDVISRRVISWLTCLPTLLEEMSEAQKTQIFKSIGRQTRFLSLNLSSTRDGYPRLLVAIALAFQALSLEGREKHIQRASADLERELDRQIFDDGVHVSRNPSLVVELLADLLPLRQAYHDLNFDIPDGLNSALVRMVNALPSLMHETGELVQFNGAMAVDPALIDAIKLHAEPLIGINPGKLSAPSSGRYEGLRRGHTAIVMDCGKPVSHICAHHTMAGTLSFELSYKGVRMIGNCGMPEQDRERYAPFARATAAHSTATIADRSSSKFADTSWLYNFLPSDFLWGPKEILVRRKSEPDYHEIVASHDGYARDLGVTHQRRLQLGANGEELHGSDGFQLERRNSRLPTQAVLRFHLPANVTASFLSNGHSVLLAGPRQTAWTFTCVDAPIKLEESIQFSGAEGPRKSAQIVISFDLIENVEIRWSMAVSQKKATRGKAKNPDKNGDLLDGLLQSEQESPSA